MIRFLAAMMLFVCSPSFSDESQQYVKAFWGFNTVSIKFQPDSKMQMYGGHILGFSYGRIWPGAFITEVEAAYRYNETKRLTIAGRTHKYIIPIRGDVSSFSVFGNIYFNVPCRFACYPYIGTGIGATAQYCNWQVNIFEDNLWFQFLGGPSFAFSYQVISGIRTTMFKKYTGSFEFRILDSVIDQMCYKNKSFSFLINRKF
jgi:hypothetical protein